jgi:hypothetical protein
MCIRRETREKARRSLAFSRVTCSCYVAYVKFSYNITFYWKIQIWLSPTKFSYCRSIIVNWKRKHYDIPTMYSLLKLVNKSINIWPFSYWSCYMPLVLKMIELRWKNNYLSETGHWRYNVREYEEGLKIAKSYEILFKHTKIKSCQQSV